MRGAARAAKGEERIDDGPGEHHGEEPENEGPGAHHVSHQVRGASGTIARLRSEPSQRLVPAVELAEYADIADVRRTQENQAVQHVRQALDAPTFPIDVELRPGQHEGRGLR